MNVHHCFCCFLLLFLAYVITYLLSRVSGVENVFLINMLSIRLKQSESTFFSSLNHVQLHEQNDQGFTELLFLYLLLKVAITRSGQRSSL